MTSLSSVSTNMPRSGIRAIGQLAMKYPDCIKLHLGEPNFPTPSHITEAAYEAAKQGFTRYTPPTGIPSLREAASAKLARVNGLTVPPERIIIAVGATSGLFNACRAILDEGDEMLMPDPGWPNWEQMILGVGGRVVRYPVSPDNNFLPVPEAMDALVGPRTKGIIINSPSNPTGAVMPGELVERMVAFARRHDLWVISDECYDEVVLDGEHVSAARFDTDGRVISAFSCSKTYAMTGWRIGYLAVPERAMDVMAKLQEPLLSSICSIAQKGAEAALNGPQHCVAEMRDYYRSQRDLAMAILSQAGVRTWTPHGAFFAMVDISNVTMDTYGFAKHLLETRGVTVAPGETFGRGGRGLVRILLAASTEHLEQGLARLVDEPRVRAEA